MKQSTKNEPIPYSLKRKKDRSTLWTFFEMFEKVFVFAFVNVVWLVVLWGVGIGKLVDSGFHDYFKHFTNWNWTLNSFYYFLEFIRIIYSYNHKDKYKNILTLYVDGFVFWLTFSASWFVFWGVFVMFANSTVIVTEIEKKYTLGFILNMEKLFHVLPAIVILFYFFIKQQVFGWTLQVLVNKSRIAYVSTWIYIIVIVCLSGIIAVALYYSTFDISSVYQIPSAVGLICVSVLEILQNILLFVFLRRRFHQDG